MLCVLYDEWTITAGLQQVKQPPAPFNVPASDGVPREPRLRRRIS